MSYTADREILMWSKYRTRGSNFSNVKLSAKDIKVSQCSLNLRMFFFYLAFMSAHVKFEATSKLLCLMSIVAQ